MIPRIFKEKLKGNNTRAKSSRHLFTFFGTYPHIFTFLRVFRIFTPWLFLWIKGFYYCFSSKRRKENKRDEKEKDQTILHFVVARLSSCMSTDTPWWPLPKHSWFSGVRKRVVSKGCFGGCSPGTKTGTRVRSPKPPFWKPPFISQWPFFVLTKGWFPKGWFRRMFPRNENRTRVRSPKHPLRNRPFISQW